MEPRHIRYFLAVVEHGTITAASEHLRVAQPALSRQLSALERRLAVRLFTRRGPRLTLTQAGVEFVKIGADIIRRLDRAEVATRQLAEGFISELSIAAASTTITEIVAPFVASLTTADPFVTARQVHSAGIHQAVRDGADIGISATRPPTRRADDDAGNHAEPDRPTARREPRWRVNVDVPLARHGTIGGRLRTVSLQDLSAVGACIISTQQQIGRAHV